jgi:lysophospholipase L1-like esterase
MTKKHLTAYAALTVLLFFLISINYILFKHGKAYYVQEGLVRLDPSGSRTGFDDGLNIKELTDDKIAVLYGDSRAAMWLKPDIAGYEFLNRGISNQTSEQALLRLQRHVRPLNPDFVLIQVGINDLKYIPLLPDRKREIVENCKANISEIVRQVNEMGAAAVLSTIFPVAETPVIRMPFWSDDVNSAVKEVNAHIRKLTLSKNVLFDSYNILAGPDGQIKPELSHDHLHLNTRGYRLLNEELSGLLKG